MKKSAKKPVVTTTLKIRSGVRTGGLSSINHNVVVIRF